MKYVFLGIITIVVYASIFLVACNAEPPVVEIPHGGPPAVPAEPVENEPTTPLASRSEFISLARKSGCLACHTIDTKLIGPAWKNVSTRYNAAEYINTKSSISETKKFLKDKVAKGGKGNWTEVAHGAPMPPYYPRVSKNNISRLVDYIMNELYKLE